MSQLLKSLVAFCFLIGSCMGQGGDCPFGWTKWKDEKCYLLQPYLSNYANAKETCTGQGGYLPTIRNEEQQAFLQNFIFNVSEVKMGVWIGAIRTPGSETAFQWEIDGSRVEVSYSNWAVDSPTPIIGRDCVAMQSRFSKFEEGVKVEPEDGKWKDVLCEAANYFVCETVPTWSIDDIKRVLIETRRSLEETKEKLEAETQRLNNEARKVENLEKNPVPVGFIYTEYHGQPSPQTIWPGVSWKDVTSTYAGLFFRALGGGSANFGEIQNADCPRLTSVGYKWELPPADFKGSAEITPGIWSDFVWTGRNYGDHDMANRYLVSNPEIRPKNAAIRIWKRESSEKFI